MLEATLNVILTILSQQFHSHSRSHGKVKIFSCTALLLTSMIICLKIIGISMIWDRGSKSVSQWSKYTIDGLRMKFLLPTFMNYFLLLPCMNKMYYEICHMRKKTVAMNGVKYPLPHHENANAIYIYQH